MILDAIQSLDIRVLKEADSLRAPLLDTTFRGLTWLGSLWILIPVAVSFSIVRQHKHSRLVAWLGPIALAATSLVVYALKELVSRPRPDLHQNLITLPIDSSFPSAHAAQAAALAIALGWRSPWQVRTALGATVIVVAFSRSYLQVHYPSDVVAGIIIGAGCALLAGRLLQIQDSGR
jgi:membrane-associated phospholipid phosphatase